MVRSNVPQMIFCMQTSNYIYGQSKNPFDVLRSNAGSSGGEGGLVAAQCTPLGFGTDFGGSVRFPAVFNSLFGFKPTTQRISYKGVIFPVEDGICP